MAFIESHGTDPAAPLTAVDFLYLIRKSHDRRWQHGSAESNWVFRGVGDSDNWTQLPSAWRPLPDNKLQPLIEKIQNADPPWLEPRGSIESYSHWATAETEAIYQFSLLASKLGHALDPCWWSLDGMRHLVSMQMSPGMTPNIKTAPLAQHHGIPTRLLDWTEDPLFAAFFAVAPQFRSPTATAVSVWCCDATAIETLRFRDSNNGLHQPFKIHKQAGYRNQYLQAQRGLFIEIIAGECFFDEEGCWPSIEDYCDAAIVKEPAEPCFVQFVLRENQFATALELLNREGVNHAALMPSLDTVAATVIDRWQF